MKKGKGIGIAVAVIAVIVVLGIASIPDEVLLENPSVETSVIEDKEIQIPVIEEPKETVPEEPPVEVVEEPKETVPEEPTVEVVEEPKETVPEETEPEETGTAENVIEVRIKDGIGSKDR